MTCRNRLRRRRGVKSIVVMWSLTAGGHWRLADRRLNCGLSGLWIALSIGHCRLRIALGDCIGDCSVRIALPIALRIGLRIADRIGGLRIALLPNAPAALHTKT